MTPPAPDDARPPQPSGHGGMVIPVLSGSGTGPTKLAAFDAALLATGTGNRNLVHLSSVIPPGSMVTVSDGPIDAPGEWGDRLYVVLAEARSAHLGDRLAAGIGWVQEEGTGRGLFVEHQGHSVDEVETHIHDSLDSMVRSRGIDFGEVSMEISATVCDAPAACALVIAVLESQPWAGGAGAP